MAGQHSQNGPRELPPRLRGPLFRYRELRADFLQARDEMERLQAEMDRVWLQLTDEERAGLDAPEVT